MEEETHIKVQQPIYLYNKKDKRFDYNTKSINLTSINQRYKYLDLSESESPFKDELMYPQIILN